MKWFSPWGSREFSNVINHLHDNADLSGPHGLGHTLTKDFSRSKKYLPVLLCHDQEPLNYDLHASKNKVDEYISNINPKLGKFYPPYDDLNIAFKIYHSWQKQWILLHSELESPEVKRYESTGHYIGAYWWSHALLARDWYRYAEHDMSLNFISDDKKLFLVYSREMTGSRCYRQTVIDCMKQQLDQNSYQIGSFHGKPVGSDYSARYETEDYVRTDISLVLETVADQRIHLTEKTLRPIACGHPFILMAGAGSLSVLKKYGFETFSPWINESYDLEADQQTRIKMIVNEMSRIEKLNNDEKHQVVSMCKEIAQRNREMFFSKKFLDKIISELKKNVETAFSVTQGAIDYNLIDEIHNRRDELYPGWREFY